MNAKLRDAIKKKDGWWATLFSGPLANILLRPICDISWITPNLITVSSLGIGILAGLCFAQGKYSFLVIGAFLVQLSFVVDCMDGQLARYRQQFSKLGAWLDRISDRVKDFWYFFTLAWGFYSIHPQVFFLGPKNLSDFLAFVLGPKVFQLPAFLSMCLMKQSEISSWIIWPLAMIAMFSVFLIDYYVNQDMKLEAAPDSHAPTGLAMTEAKQSPSFALNLIKSFFKFGLNVYKSVPILRFNIGEQALLISIFCLLNSVYHLMCVFALLGTFYLFYWPVAKYFGFSPEK
ncbi:MAG: CDP-alcohol phosphatidyltransferase family protein [Candidatus Caenarcaniphilales bacterium]|nr:CDP-alcohol phosphatidyltransferase family protein [Candidatus Caenarcaniphilales bacterium]